MNLIHCQDFFHQNEKKVETEKKGEKPTMILIKEDLIQKDFLLVRGRMAERFTNTTGKRLRALREDLGIKQGDLAKTIGVRQSYLSEMENDKANPTADIIARLAKELRTTSDYVLMLSNIPTIPGDDRPTQISPEAEAAAKIIDELPEKFRPECLFQVQQVKVHAERNRVIREELDLIERDFGAELRTRITKAFGLETS